MRIERSAGPSSDHHPKDGGAHERKAGSRSAATRSEAAGGQRDGSTGERPPLAYLRVLDALVYAVGVAFVLSFVATLASFAVGGGWGGVKYVLFFVGFSLFGITAFRLRPAGAWTEEKRSSPNREETRFQAVVQATPPLRQYDLMPNERLPVAAKLFVASVVVLGVSFAMEAVFGVAA